MNHIGPRRNYHINANRKVHGAMRFNYFVKEEHTKN